MQIRNFYYMLRTLLKSSLSTFVQMSPTCLCTDTYTSQDEFLTGYLIVFDHKDIFYSNDTYYRSSFKYDHFSTSNVL